MPTRAARKRHTRQVVVVLIGIFVVVYTLVVTLYALSSRLEPATDPPPVDDDVVQLFLQPQSMNAVGNRLGMTLEVIDTGPLGDPRGTTLLRALTVAVTGVDGPRLVEFAADTLPYPISVPLITSGYVEFWPFDRYTVTTTVVAFELADADLVPLTTDVWVSGQISGWNIEAEQVDAGGAVLVDGAEQEVPSITITAVRSGGTIAFGVVLLTLMIVMPVLVLIVAIAVYVGRRKVEPTLMGWTAAMLFATIPLRTFLPGSPPIGSWIDFLIVLWVIVGLVVGLAIYVAAWLRWSPRLHPHREEDREADARAKARAEARVEAARADAASADAGP